MSMIEYAPKTERLHRENRSVNGYWPVGIDYGFSAVKGFSPNKVFCFPNCAIQQKNDESILDPDDTDIIIRIRKGPGSSARRPHRHGLFGFYEL